MIMYNVCSSSNSRLLVIVLREDCLWSCDIVNRVIGALYNNIKDVKISDSLNIRGLCRLLYDRFCCYIPCNQYTNYETPSNNKNFGFFAYLGKF